MSRTVRRLVFALLVAAGVGALTTLRRQRLAAAEHPSSAAWPPFEPLVSTPDASPADSPPAASPPVASPLVDARRWVEPVDGACPPGYPVKANDNSGIFHVPGGRFYDRTVPERCYASAEDAAADGYRAAKA
jgi:hypothetical protein